jgi:hypothetical protein
LENPIRKNLARSPQGGHYTGCPPLKQYSEESNKALAQKIPALPSDVQERITDYRQLRKECGQP